MLKIKLTRTGKKNQAYYRIVVSEARAKRDGKYIESLGYYQPLSKPSNIKIDKKRFDYWVEKGAKPTQTVRSIYKKVA
jgi:small subunit ribosomal protein S16